MVLEDESVITLGEKAELLVDEFVYDPGKSKGNLALTVSKGAFLFVGGKIESIKDSKVKITTPVAEVSPQTGSLCAYCASRPSWSLATH